LFLKKFSPTTAPLHSPDCKSQQHNQKYQKEAKNLNQNILSSLTFVDSRNRQAESEEMTMRKIVGVEVIVQQQQTNYETGNLKERF